VRKILPVIVISQFFCTSVWFAANPILNDIAIQMNLSLSYLALLTSSVQFGFIIGTLIFALLSISDRFSPSLVFFICAILASMANLIIIIPKISLFEIMVFRFSTGFFLAGIYPVGMKIASDYYKQGLGRSLGFLIGALVLGTAFPHLLKSLTKHLPWESVILYTSFFALIGGTLVYKLIPDGPYRHLGSKLEIKEFLNAFYNPYFRSIALGYFGHQWEIYSFWVFLPLMLSLYNQRYPMAHINVPLFSFMIIAMGSLACVISGLLSQFFDSKKLVKICLLLSGICCGISPIMLLNSSKLAFISFLFIWGWLVVADSPLFSALIAQNAPKEIKGTTLTIVNCIGYGVTIISIQFINALRTELNSQFIYALLCIGPFLGCIALFKKLNFSKGPLGFKPS